MSRKNEHVRPGETLQVIHAFVARSPDELSLSRGDRVELIEKDDDFGDGWYLGKHLQNGKTGLFPEVYTQPAPKPTLSSRPAPKTPISEPVTPALPSQATKIDSVRTGDYSMNDSNNIQEENDVPTNTAASSSTLSTPAPLQTSAPNGSNSRSNVGPAVQRSIGMALSGDVGSPVMNETLSVIDEHITDLNTPRQSVAGHDRRAANNDSGSEYSSHLDQRISYIHGEETDEEESTFHTETEVLTWDPQRVAEYLEDAGVAKKHCDVFREQEINGEALLGMDQPTIFLKEFDLGPVGPRLRTWMKIKALQQEVKSAGTVSRGPSQYMTDDTSSNRSASMGAVLPRIPSLGQVPGSHTPTRQTTRSSLPTSSRHNNTQSSASGVNTRESTPPLAPAGSGHAHRPSAASVRSLNHNRRHSAIESAPSPLLDDTEGIEALGAARSSHRKEPSFDRDWTMGGGPKSAESIRPASSIFHSHSQSAASANITGAAPVEQNRSNSNLSVAEVDRGYFSGNELDNRKSMRNVLRKRDNPSHSRQTSYRSESSKRVTDYVDHRHSRVASADSPASSMSAAALAYYGQSHRNSGNKRNNTVPLLETAKPLTTKDSPTVTKLDYSGNHSIDAVANSPKDSSSMGRASPSPATSSSFFKKKRIVGLRAISDAITGGEKASYAPSTDSTLVASSPIKDSPLQSPTRTGSTTPTTTTKSFDMSDPEKAKRTTTGSSSSAPSFAAKRRNKKITSAYTRGLEQKSPTEQMEGCDYSGWMKKKSSSMMTTWKPRLFVLRGRRLSYYYSEFDTEEKGLIDISSHRVLPANEEKLTGIHATVTRAMASPSSPNNATITTSAQADAAKAVAIVDDNPGAFIFKLVPPRNGMSRGVNFTKPTVHYFAVDNIVQGRLWMAALMKATIDKDPEAQVLSTYKDKTISLAKAMKRRERPPALMGSDDESDAGTEVDVKPVDKGLAIIGLVSEKADSGVGDDKSLPKVSSEMGASAELVATPLEEAPPPPIKDEQHAEKAEAAVEEHHRLSIAQAPE
ncbi:hypothetical protein EJ05DRAFT_476009 [Pseudovirgaria hyperparasitica]|uniref:Polarized growth protein Boi2 n=1 Tax=Pseudovirgaria hyperparasitica TaxID=470096 RepID=A0A6A6W739_9PEZI|nr:uncharacterized protein EJ05DRAFT_476009 [Pseudovirgaria hyperparasitica]KAF2758698.1 hypothetical protein EJ05DRAFT_476009 [Pseudovirgaria hyperparasitica]